MLSCPRQPARASVTGGRAFYVRITILLSLVFSVLTSVAAAQERPTLVVRGDQLARLRAAVSTGPAAQEFGLLRAYFASELGPERLPGELLGSAFLHLIAPDEPEDAVRLLRIERSLRDPIELNDDWLELALTLNWSQQGFSDASKRAFLSAAMPKLVTLAASDSPLSPRDFRVRLASLIVALSLPASAELDPAWPGLREDIRSAASRYFQETFPRYLELRGPTPTAPAHAAQEEADTFLAIECADALLDGTYWKRVTPLVRDWLSHYLLAAGMGRPYAYQPLRDNTAAVDLRPVPEWSTPLPLAPYLLAVRTESPAAVRIARELSARIRGSQTDVRSRPWAWLPLLFPLEALTGVDTADLPTAFNLKNALVFRGRDAEGGPLIVWIEAGQPYLRPGQHFDAGHFLVFARGYQTVTGGADISTEATPLKGGEQRLGSVDGPFDFDQYRVATIAHNALVLYDDVMVERWGGQPFLPVGGQRLGHGVCSDFSPPPGRAADPRIRGRVLAFGADADAAYAAIDLTAAYAQQTTPRYTREFLFLREDRGARLLVIDRVAVGGRSIRPIWVCNLPGPPIVEGEPLTRFGRVAGSEPGAGIWTFTDASRVGWSGGACRLDALIPADKRIAVAGGPAAPLTISKGTYRGWTYMGGSEDSFERLITPATSFRPKNAWYRLGRPTSLGAAFEAAPHWGRIEIEPLQPSRDVVFAMMLSIDRDAPGVAERPERPEVMQSADAWTVRAGDVTIRLPRGAIGGTVLREGRPEWRLPETVAANPDWAREP
jgi:hypothetical protein